MSKPNNVNKNIEEQTVANEFFSLAPKHRTKKRLNQLIKQWRILKKEFFNLIKQSQEEADGKTWYFEGDELVIKKGKWVIDRYKRQYHNQQKE